MTKDDGEAKERIEAAMVESLALLTDASGASRYVVRVNEADLRTLIAAYTRMEADMAEARKLMNPFIEASENLDDTNDFDDDELWEHAAAMGLHVRDLRALAAFYNKGEE